MKFGIYVFKVYKLVGYFVDGSIFEWLEFMMFVKCDEKLIVLIKEMKLVVKKEKEIL